MKDSLRTSKTFNASKIKYQSMSLNSSSSR